MADLAETTETVEVENADADESPEVDAVEETVVEEPVFEETVVEEISEDDEETPEDTVEITDDGDESSGETQENAPEETLAEVAAETTPEVVEEAPADAVEGTLVVDEAPADAVEETPVVEEPKPVSPYDQPGDWYVIHSYSGYENKVKANLETRIQSMHMEDRIFEVHIPMEDVVEFKGGKKVTVPKKVFPGYILVRMSLDDDSWYAVRNTPGVTGFVAGNAQKPTPLSRREVERFLGVQKEEEKGKPRFKPDWEIGEQVRVVTGPFADFNGVIEEINIDQQKIVVLVNIFGRDTPVELGFDDIQKS